VAVHDDGASGGHHVRSDRVTVHLAGDGVAVSAGDRREASTSVAAHRTDVVRRLLDRGLSPATLHALLPEFGGLIDDVTDRDRR
jgi:hypothetical protein